MLTDCVFVETEEMVDFWSVKIYYLYNLYGDGSKPWHLVNPKS